MTTALELEDTTSTNSYLIDSHCHLDLAKFDEDRAAVIQRAQDNNVRQIVNPGIDLQHSQQAIDLSERYDSVYAAVGIHPNSSDTFDGDTIDRLHAMSQQTRVVAIGEIGLDYYWDKVEPAQQKIAFEGQLDLAAQLGLPVIIHSRESNDDVAAILRSWVAGSAFQNSPLAQNAYAGVLHAYSGDLPLAQEAYEWNFVLSLGGPVTFKNARALHELVPHLRLDRLMLETDAPFLTPHPHRGKRNEPAYIPMICQQIANLCGSTPEQVATTTTDVARRFFKLENFCGAENSA